MRFIPSMMLFLLLILQAQWAGALTKSSNQSRKFLITHLENNKFLLALEL